MWIWILGLFVILHSQITQECPQITPDHTRGSQNHAFGTYFLYWASPKKLFSTPFPNLGRLRIRIRVIKFKSEHTDSDWKFVKWIRAAIPPYYSFATRFPQTNRAHITNGAPPIKAGLPRSHPKEGRLCIFPADQPIGRRHGDHQEQAGHHPAPAGRLNARRPGDEVSICRGGQAAEHQALLHLLAVAAGENSCVSRWESIVWRWQWTFLGFYLEANFRQTQKMSSITFQDQLYSPVFALFGC